MSDKYQAMRAACTAYIQPKGNMESREHSVIRSFKTRLEWENVCHPWAILELLDEIATLKATASQESAPGQEAVALTLPPELHERTKDLVIRFATALAEKLYRAEQKYGYSDGWMNDNWLDECRDKLNEHVAKGDPRDVAAYCAFLWHHGASTSTVPTGEQQAVYQRREIFSTGCKGFWHEVTEERYELSDPGYEHRTLYLAPPTSKQS